MNNIQEILIEKNYIDINGAKIYPPFSVEDFVEKLGDGKVKETGMEYSPEVYVWEKLGIQAFPNAEKTIFRFIEICINKGQNIFTINPYQGIVKIGGEPYENAKWKFDSEFAYSDELEYGCFSLSTVLNKNLHKLKDSDYMSYRIQIEYIKPLEKEENIYKLKEIAEPVLQFKSFGFKLAIIQSLMYDRELLTPRFDIYDFAMAYEEREIDIEDEGYEPIPEAVKWFQDLQIPVTLADEITELIVDGGNEIYGQIIPYWDGEDSFFDIKNVSEEEIRQFKNLKRMEIMPQDNWSEMDVFKRCGIEVEEI